MDRGGGGGAGGDVNGGERWAPSGRQLTASLVGLNVFVVLLIYYYMWRFFSGKSDGGGDDDDAEAESSAAPSRPVSPKAGDRQAMELAITALPVFVVHLPSDSGDDDGAGDAAAADDANGGGGGGKVLECAICISEFADGEEGRLLPRCGHRFHARCVDMWFQLHSTCPLCRAGVLPPPPACPTTAPHDDGQQQAVAPPPDTDMNSTDNCPFVDIDIKCTCM
uniref:RING-type E3 ubiquitin transferase n=1 Tax=Oryza punctata TaxID=4537 RepID=A0A0E0L1I2_ORYPU